MLKFRKVSALFLEAELLYDCIVKGGRFFDTCSESAGRKEINMRQEATFMALGGAQRVGGSCYFLRFGKANILLDAGGSIHRGMASGPRFSELLGSPYLESMKQITHIFISHAHNDHVAALIPILEEAPHAQIYMTDMTWKLTGLQLNKQLRPSKPDGDFGDLLRQKQMDRITRVSFMQTIDCGGFQATFLPAGHIPGAMMVLLDDGHREILYTGDYSVEDTALTGACYLPEEIRVDTMILCALHAKHPYYSWRANELVQAIQRVFQTVREKKRNVLCKIGQLSKGVELLVAMNALNTEHVPIRIAPSVMDMVELLESSGCRVLTADNYDGRAASPREPYIYLTSEDELPMGIRCVEQGIDFSLHDDFEGMKQLLKRVNPRQAIMVHCAPARSSYEHTIEQEILKDPECQTQFIFPEEGIAYLI